MKSVDAYELDVAGAGSAAVAAASRPPAGAAPHAWSETPPSLPAAVRGSLSLFAPGAGQFVRGEIAPGLFFVSWVPPDLEILTTTVLARSTTALASASPAVSVLSTKYRRG